VRSFQIGLSFTAVPFVCLFRDGEFSFLVALSSAPQFPAQRPLFLVNDSLGVRNRGDGLAALPFFWTSRILSPLSGRKSNLS